MNNPNPEPATADHGGWFTQIRAGAALAVCNRCGCAIALTLDVPYDVLLLHRRMCPGRATVHLR